MQKWGLLIMAIFPSFLFSHTSYSLIFVHIGEDLPPYLEIVLAQARLFNETSPILLIANERALENFSSSAEITLISCESLRMTPEHQKFIQKTKLNEKGNQEYWRYTSERFLYLYDYMEAFDAKNLFHLENDMLLYVDLEKLLPLFQTHYPALAATFENPFKCIPGFVYLSDRKAMQKLAAFFAKKASKALTDMQVMALFWEEESEGIDSLPMITERYLLDHTPSSFENRLLKSKLRHANHLDVFQSIFDGAAIGVFLDGIDPNKGCYPPGYLMKRLFNPSLLDYRWVMDEKMRKVPFMEYGGESYRINNLHIASKRVERFTSKKWPW